MFNLDLRYIILPPGPLPPLDQLHRQATPCRSFVFNFLGLLWVHASGLAQSLIDTGGTARLIQNTGGSFGSGAAATVDYYGIQVGTGLTPPAPEDYNLVAQITHGNGAGQLMHAGTALIQPYIVGSLVYAAIRRNFTNQSGAPITIYEIAWVHRGYIGSTSYFLLGARDLIPGGSLVAAGATKQVIYTLATEA